MKNFFRKFANTTSNIAGSAWAFVLALLIVIIWALTGPLFDYSNTWQLVINTSTTIITFLMVFLIQNTQNRDSKAMQIKLDELIRATRASDTYIDIEDLSDDELAELADKFSRIHKQESNNATLIKFNRKLEDTLTKRRKMPGEDVANHVANMLNPFSNSHDDKDIDHKNSKTDKK